MAQNKQIRSLAERAEITFRILPKRTFDLKSGYWIFLTNKFCMIFFNTRLPLAEEKNRVFFEQVSGKEWNFDFFPYRTKKPSQFVCTSATLTTTRFPFFGAFIIHPAVGKAAGWIRSEILNIFLFLLHWLHFWEPRKVDFCKHHFRRMAIITAVAPLSFKWSKSQWYHGTIIELNKNNESLMWC